MIAKLQSLFMCLALLSFVASKDDFASLNRLFIKEIFIMEGWIWKAPSENWLYFKDYSGSNRGRLEIYEKNHKKSLHYWYNANEAYLFDYQSGQCKAIDIKRASIANEFNNLFDLHQEGKEIYIGGFGFLWNNQHLQNEESENTRLVRGIRNYIFDSSNGYKTTRAFLSGNPEKTIRIQMLDRVEREKLRYEILNTSFKYEKNNSKNLLISKIWRLPWPCVKISQDFVTASLMGNFERFSTVFEMKSVLTGVINRYKLEADVNMGIYKIYDLKELDKWLFQDIKNGFAYDWSSSRPLNIRCTSNVHTKQRSWMHPVVQFVQELNHLSLYRYAGLDMDPQNYCEIYERTLTKDGLTVLYRLCATRIEKGNMQTYIPVYIRSFSFQNGMENYEEDAIEANLEKSGHFFHFFHLEKNQPEYRTRFDLTPCLGDRLNSVRYATRLSYDSRMTRNDHELLFKAHKPELESQILSKLEQTSEQPLHLFQSLSIEPEQRWISVGFTYIRPLGPSSLFEQVIGLDWKDQLQEHPGMIYFFEQCAQFTFPSMGSDKRHMCFHLDNECMSMSDEELDKLTHNNQNSESNDHGRLMCFRHRSSDHENFDTLDEIKTILSKIFANTIRVQDFEFKFLNSRSHENQVPVLSGSFQLVEAGSDLPSSIVSRRFVHGSVRSRSQCYRECSLASHPTTDDQLSSNQIQPFRCLSFSFCQVHGNQEGIQPNFVCKLSKTLLEDSSHIMALAKTDNADCSVYQLNPLKQFHQFKEEYIIDPSNERLSYEFQTTEDECALNCLAMGPKCQTFVVFPTFVEDSVGILNHDGKMTSKKIQCDYYSSNYFDLSMLDSESISLSHNLTSTVYSLNLIQDFQQVPIRPLKYVVRMFAFEMRKVQNTREQCALFCYKNKKCTAFNFCYSTSMTMGISGHEEGICDMEVDSETGYHDDPNNPVYTQVECITYEKQTAFNLVSQEIEKIIEKTNSKSGIEKGKNIEVGLTKLQSFLIYIAFTLFGTVFGIFLSKRFLLLRASPTGQIGVKVEFNRSTERLII